LKKVVVVEDESAIREFIVINLRRAGYEVFETSDGLKATEILNEHNFNFDIAILDVMMPGMDGIELCKYLRSNNDIIGIVILTAKSQEIDKVSGLMYGADDYVVKPFSPSELIARVDALYRRVAVNAKRVENKFKHEMEFGEFVLNLINRTLKKNGVAIDLTRIEFQIIEYLFSNPGTVLAREDILRHVWNQDVGKKFIGDEKIIDVNIRRLRMKLEDNPSQPKYIITVWGTGYKLELN